MAESTINNVVLRLPPDLRLEIYSFIFAINFGPIHDLAATRDYIRAHYLPPRAVCLQDPSYASYRQLQKSPSVYSQYANHQHDFAMWPDPVEEAFFRGKAQSLPVDVSFLKYISIGYEDTILCPPGRIKRPCPANLLVGGEHSPWAPVLRSRGISLSAYRRHGEIISDIILALTGQFRSYKAIASHEQILKKSEFCDLSRLMQIPDRNEDTSRQIVLMATMKDFAMHDKLYKLLQTESAFFSRDIAALEILVWSISPAFRQPISCLKLFATREDYSRIAGLVGRGNLPGLELLVVDLSGEDGGGDSGGRELFKESLARARLGVSVELCDGTAWDLGDSKYGTPRVHTVRGIHDGLDEG